MKFELAELPSRGILVDKERFDHLEIKKPGLTQLSLFSQAVSNNNPANFAEGISLLLNIPLTQLTIGDFYTVVTYLRCSSFKNTPLSLSWVCDGYWYTEGNSPELIKAPDARELIQENTGTRLIPHSCGHTNTQTFAYEDIAKVYLPETVEIDTSMYAIPHAGLYAEYVRLAQDAAMRELLPSIQWLREGKTLAQKLEWLKQQGEADLDIFDQASKYNEMYVHGTSNKLIGTCSKCGTQVAQKFELTAESFFRGV